MAAYKLRTVRRIKGLSRIPTFSSLPAPLREWIDEQARLYRCSRSLVSYNLQLVGFATVQGREAAAVRKQLPEDDYREPVSAAGTKRPGQALRVVARRKTG